MENRVVVWFSCGAASAVAAKIAATHYTEREIAIVYCDTGGEHLSNRQFLRDVQDWIGREIVVLRNEKYRDHFDVFEEQRFLAGVMGAPCTRVLKRELREKFQRDTDTHVFGYTVEEKKRASDFEARNSELTCEWLLIKAGLTHADCIGIIDRVGIELPAMYKLGYNHNNCIGCVKGGAGYWNKIRTNFPEAFLRMAAIERDIGHAIVRLGGEPVYLDKLSADAGNYAAEPSIICSLHCEIAVAGFETV